MVSQKYNVRTDILNLFSIKSFPNVYITVTWIQFYLIKYYQILSEYTLRYSNIFLMQFLEYNYSLIPLILKPKFVSIAYNFYSIICKSRRKSNARKRWEINCFRRLDWFVKICDHRSSTRCKRGSIDFLSFFYSDSTSNDAMNGKQEVFKLRENTFRVVGIHGRLYRKHNEMGSRGKVSKPVCISVRIWWPAYHN